MAGYKYNPLLKLGLQEEQDIPTPPTVTVDDELSTSSTNPVQNKVITEKINEITSDGIDIDVTTLSEFVAAVQRSAEVNVRIHLRADISLDSDLTVDLSKCEVYGHDHKINLQNKTFFIDGDFCYFNQVRFNASTLVTATTANQSDYENANIKIISKSSSTRYFFEYVIFLNFICHSFDGQVSIIKVDTTSSSSPSLHLYFMFCEVVTNFLGSYYPRINDCVWSVQNIGNSLHALSAHMIDYWGGAVGNNIYNTTKKFNFSGNALQGYAQLAWICDGSCEYAAAPSGFTRLVPNSTNIYNPSYSEYKTLYDYVHGNNFATYSQGAKADSALQSIEHGTDGDYITTTVSAKDANKQQTVSASLTIQTMSGADSSHKGIPEASDVKDYITSNTATKQQGEKANSALQSISAGTDGDYITTTASAKDSNNEQTVGVAATIQDISTADTDHRGLLEALTTRNYIDTQVYNVSLNFFFYGVQWDENDPSSDCTRIGNMSLHAELPIQNAIIGGLLADDLTFTPFPDQSDWSGETLDGSAGQIMLQIPKHYFKSEVNGTVHKKLISQYPLAGFNEIPLLYVSAEKATVDRTDPTTPKLCSVVNTTAAFRGGANVADWDGTYRSLLGFPATNISLTGFRQYARNRAAGTAWNCHTYLAQRVLYWLFVTEYATLNSQKPYNSEKDANGYMQGGLGPGASNWTGDPWLAYNNYNPLIPCGYMVEFGNRTAVKNYSVKDADDNVLVTFEVNSYRGIQSPFADIWDWMDGILFNVQSDEAGGVSTCYVTDDPAKFSSTDFSQYREVGSTPRADNWIKTIYDGEEGDIICKSQPGSSTSYYCDYYWGANLPASGVSLRGCLFGGRAHLGALCGFLCASSNLVPANVHPGHGSRLCAIPPP